MFKAEKSLLDMVVDNELIAFKNQALSEATVDVFTNKIDDGNVLFKIPANRTALEILTDGMTSHCLDFSKLNTKDSSHIENYHTWSFIQDVTKNFININANANFVDCINIAHTYQQLAKENLYGILFRAVDNPDIIINPFHILTALSIMENDEYLNIIKFNILVYTYPDRSHIDSVYNTHYADTDKINNNIDSLMQLYTTKLSTNLKLESFEEVAPDNPLEYGINMEVSQGIRNDEDPDKVYYISTQQLVTKGIIAPYYGASLITWDRKHNRDCTGMSLSPMNSANLSHNTYVHFTDINENKRSYSVCTGDLSNYSYEGLCTLTHSNLSSPYRENNLVPGFVAYIDAMIDRSTDLYIRAGIIIPIADRPVPSITERFTPEQIAATTLREFLTLRSTDVGQVSLARAVKEFNEIKAYKESLEQDS